MEMFVLMVVVALLMVWIGSDAETPKEPEKCSRHTWDLKDNQLVCMKCGMNPVLETKIEAWENDKD